MRGNRLRKALRGQRLRSIPARAGEPNRLENNPAFGRVYPRACGGTSRSAGISAAASGLSPRVRGNQSLHQSQGYPPGSIPARAGEPSGCAFLSRRRRVYPRACGGTKVSIQRCPTGAGLSPRVRGNLLGCAPQPLWKSAGHWVQGVYPRACGGTSLVCARHRSRTGLSPRVRGNRRPRSRSGHSRRSIPARAGEPASTCQIVPCSWVYPRACGGTAKERRPAGGHGGLSPRVRGNPQG